MNETSAADCLFCKIVEGRIPADIVYEDDQVVAFNDINPQAPVHILLIPRQHVSTINDLNVEDKEQAVSMVGNLILRARALAAEKGIEHSGYRLIMNCNEDGGQTVFHIHLHLLGGRPLRALG